mgnify:FL=1|jgi:NADPH:quinone reductase-like Zn-dependent oxidoreductase
MKAAVHRKYGLPSEVINIEAIAKPVCKAGELLIKVHCSSVNCTDCGFVRAKPFVTRFFSGLRKPKRQVLGCEFAGIIENVASGVDGFVVGDRVFGFDDSYWGGHGQYLTIPAEAMVAKIPNSVSIESTAIASEGGHYAPRYIGH